jgi:hypothetical protein
MGYSAVVGSVKARWGDDFSPENLLGVSARKACNDMLYLYSWEPDGRETVTNREETWGLLFSGPAWLSESICVGILLEFDAAFEKWDGSPISPDVVEEFFGGKVKWAPPSAKEAAHYDYKLDVGKMKVYTNDDGSVLREGAPILIQTDGHEIKGPFPPLRKERLLSDARKGERWEPVNNYVVELGEPLERIAAAHGSAAASDEWGGVYCENAAGVKHWFEKDGLCHLVEAPLVEIFPELADGSMGVYEFLEAMGVRAKWFIGGDMYGRDCLYSFWFEDALILVSSSIDREVSKDDRVFIKRS